MIDDADLSDRRDDQHLIGRINQVETKVDRVVLTLDHLSENFKIAMDNIVSRQEDRWKLIEQRLDMGGREHGQAVKLLTETVARHEIQQVGMDTHVQLLAREQDGIGKDVQDTKATLDVAKATLDVLGREHLVLTSRTDGISNDVQDIKGTLSKIAWTLVGLVVTIIGSIVGYVLTHAHFG